MIFAAAVAGLLVGSFLNVVAIRVPEGRSVLGGRSACASCKATLAPRDLVPVASWLWTRGRCRHCGNGVNWQYPVVEGLTALVFAALAAQVEPLALLPAALWLAGGLIAGATVDVRLHRLPNKITGGTMLGVVPLLVFASAWTGEWERLGTAAVVAAAGFGLFFALHVLVPGGMGAGDVKLVVPIGLVLGWGGWELALVAFVAAFALGAAVGIGLIVGSRAFRSRRHVVPFGPFLATGAIFALVAGAGAAGAYANLWLPVGG